MDDVDITDTAAFRISRQIMDHIYGDDEKMDGDEFGYVAKEFGKRGGSWEGLMSGSMASVTVLEDSIASLVNLRRIAKIAFRVYRGR